MRNQLITNQLRTIFVPEAGLEPARPEEHRILSPACLPIPPLGHPVYYLKNIELLCNHIVQKKSLHVEGSLERKTGFEPATPTLARSCSTS